MKSINRILFIRVFAFSLMAAGCFCLNNCHLGPEGDPIIGVNGFIYDKNTHNLLEGAWFDRSDTTDPHFGITDTTGRFYIFMLGDPPKVMHLYFGKGGYKTLDTVIQIPLNDRIVDSVEVYLDKE